MARLTARCARRTVVVAAIAALGWPASAAAHGFGALYNLPVPLWLYAWGAGAALVVSFLVAGLFMTARPAVGDTPRQIVWTTGTGRARLRTILRIAGVCVLALCIATGFFGHRDPLRNFSMTAFWIHFLLLLTYLTALVGNLYAALNPWRGLADGLDRVWRGFAQGHWRYPAWLGDWPALALYLGFIWFELFGTGRPQPLAVFLTGYTALNLFGVWAVGARAWFGHCEFFSVFFRLIALMAPVAWQHGAVVLRWPFAGLVHARPAHVSTVAFALAMLATTAFDGLTATRWWVSIFWGDPTGWLTAWAGAPPVRVIAIVQPWFKAWETVWLFITPLLYLGLYLLTIWLARLLTRSDRTVRDLALDFGYTLLPIALVYHLTHYATLILSHGLKIISLASDPFGWGWNLFGTAHTWRAPVLVDMGVVWHTQVGLIVAGHVVSVWVAHRIALRVFGTPGRAVLSQIPMLALMIAFTVAGLWILAQPLTTMTFR